MPPGERASRREGLGRRGQGSPRRRPIEVKRTLYGWEASSPAQDTQARRVSVHAGEDTEDERDIIVALYIKQETVCQKVLLETALVL